MSPRFNSDERKLIFGISMIMGLRMLGVSMIIPMFSIFATELPRSTKTLAGMAVGLFGIMQMLLQVPVGKLSDRWGRKQVTILGLTVYFFGTIFSGLSKSIFHLIGARGMAGAGAITGVTIAWLTEGVNENRRSSALSYVGISMGSAVIIGFTLSPVLAAKIGVPFLFYICAAIILITIFYIARYMNNNAVPEEEHIDLRKEKLMVVFKNRDLLRLNLIGLVGNLTLNSVFFVMPLLIKQKMELSAMWKIYIPMSLIGTTLMFYFSRQADRKGTSLVTAAGLTFEIAGVLIVLLMKTLPAYVAAFTLFYAGHCIISPVLPAAVSRHPNVSLKGSVMGLFHSFQFIGAALGGVITGVLLEFDHRYVFMVLAFMLATAYYFTATFRNFQDPDYSEGPIS